MSNYPKCLGRNAAKLFEHLVKQLPEGETHLKIDNTEETFMPVIIEHLATFEKCTMGENYRVFSVAHYYEQNGDLMADPLMEFLYKPEGMIYPAVYPIYYQMDGIFQTTQQSINVGDPLKFTFDKKRQSEHVAFANKWMRNIHMQQFRTIKFPLTEDEKKIREVKSEYSKLRKYLKI